MASTDFATSPPPGEQITPVATSNETPASVTSNDRQILIDTAVRFLQNPKVAPTPLDNKRQFLAKKGLTTSEIDTALKKAGCFDTAPAQNPIETVTTGPLLPVRQSAQQLSQQTSIWIRILKWVANLVAAGCVAFTVYKLIIKKFFLNKKSCIDTKLEKMVDGNIQLQKSINDMKESLKMIKENVEKMDDVVKTLARDKIPSSPGAEDKSEIKSEIQIIKSLLLNRNQFPALPVITPVGLPPWQLEAKSNKKESETDNESNKSNELSQNEEDTKESTI